MTSLKIPPQVQCVVSRPMRSLTFYALPVVPIDNRLPVNVGNVIYDKFSHGDVSYRFKGENVNAMLELSFYHMTCCYSET